MCSVAYGHHDSGKRIRSKFRERDLWPGIIDNVLQGGVFDKVMIQNYAQMPISPALVASVLQTNSPQY
jgi:hypothetical protein